MFKHLKQLNLDEKGAISIPFVITGIIAVMIISGFLDIFFVRSMSEEIQGMSDITAVSAVRQGLDEEDMRLGRFCDDDGEHFAKYDIIQYYKNNFQKQLDGLSRVRNVSFENIQVHCQEDSTLGINGTDNDGNDLALDQVWIEADTIVTIRAGEGKWDNTSRLIKEYTNFFDDSNDSTATIVTNGVEGDGLKEIPIRSVARVVLR